LNLLFDLDGTLTDPFQGITKCILHALVSMGKPAPTQESLRWCIGPPIRDNFAKLLASADVEVLERAVGLYRDRYSSIGLFENEVYAGIPEALDALNRLGHRMYVATSKPTEYAERIASHFGIRKFFHHIHGSELDGTRSDKSSLISHVLQVESAVSEDTVMVGDREHDIVGAKANGVPAIGVLWGYGSREELEASGASICISKPKELSPTIRKMESYGSR
jgi:phosphoglycolate phosphatase